LLKNRAGVVIMQRAGVTLLVVDLKGFFAQKYCFYLTENRLSVIVQLSRIFL
jgi:hypothetical protein